MYEGSIFTYTCICICKIFRGPNFVWFTIGLYFFCYSVTSVLIDTILTEICIFLFSYFHPWWWGLVFCFLESCPHCWTIKKIIACLFPANIYILYILFYFFSPTYVFFPYVHMVIVHVKHYLSPGLKRPKGECIICINTTDWFSTSS